MKGKELHDFLFKLYDFADYLADKIEEGHDKSGPYFLTLVYIEQIFDLYGRGMLSEAAREAEDSGLDAGLSLSEAHKRIDLLRNRIGFLIQSNDFDETLKSAGTKMFDEWRKRLN